MIDFHVHQPARVGGELPYSATEYAEFAAGLGIELSAIFTFDGLRHPGAAANDSLAAFAAEVPGRFVAFATVDPTDPGAADEIRRCVREHGMRGVKLHPWVQAFSPHSPGLDPICEVAAELGIPILFHDGTPPFSAPLQLAVLARRHPRTAIVLGHGGLHDLWREAAAAVAAAPNVHVCLCATPPYALRALIDRCPLERILYGTDGGLAPEPRQQYVALRVRHLDGLGLGERQRAAILDENPRRLLGL
ncbi:MAG TPA: amidohydrolase family protein [Gaiellaceae bacterium]|nr:amidohydrolase family protein [Gaiellaceae bacterium]